MATAPIELDQKLSIKWPHTVHTMLSMNRVSQVTAAQWTRWNTLLEAPNLQFIHTSPVNPVTLLPISEGQKEGGGEETDEVEEEYDGVEILQHSDEAAQAAKEPLQNLNLGLFTFVENGIRKAGLKLYFWSY
eukprot:g26454.t1